MKAFIVAGLAFGDEGKGTVTDYLVRKYGARLVVRYNGGCQAAHNVVTADGKHHTFSQFGSGTLSGADTHLSRFMLVDPITMARESVYLESLGVANPMSRVTVDPEAVIVTPFHRLTNRARERQRGASRHSSVGVGIGEAREDELAGVALRMIDLFDTKATAAKLAEIRQRKTTRNPDLSLDQEFDAVPVQRLCSSYQSFAMSVGMADSASVIGAQFQPVVFEGAQGVLLDEHYGLEPYRTWTDCTYGNALDLLREVPGASIERVGVLRSYYTRHGSGPFPTEDQALNFPEPHNVAHPWMGKFRQGHFDAVLANYAIRAVGGIDTLALTHLDRRMYHFPVRVGDDEIWHPRRVEYKAALGPGHLMIDLLGLRGTRLIAGMGPRWIDKIESVREKGGAAA